MEEGDRDIQIFPRQTKSTDTGFGVASAQVGGLPCPDRVEASPAVILFCDCFVVGVEALE